MTTDGKLLTNRRSTPRSSLHIRYTMERFPNTRYKSVRRFSIRFIHFRQEIHNIALCEQVHVVNLLAGVHHFSHKQMHMHGIVQVVLQAGSFFGNKMRLCGDGIQCHSGKHSVTG